MNHPPVSSSHQFPPLMGLATLMSMACSGIPLTETANSLMVRIKANSHDANALMDLSIISHLWFKHEIGLTTQAQALKIARLYRLPAASEPAIRLLALMQHGDLAANAPLEFLVQDSDIALDMLYLDPSEPFPVNLPEHDLLFVAVGESEHSQLLLHQIAAQLPSLRVPLFNQPARIAALARDSVSAMLQGLPGIDMPPTWRLTRAELERPAHLAALLVHMPYPLIIRPLDSHAGIGLEKLDRPDALPTYLQTRNEQEFFVSRFVDYRNDDGLFRKYRIVIIAGRAYAGHMALSAHWMIHYLNANMAENSQKRDEEAAFFADFDTAFGARHGTALQAISDAAGLDYVVIDCAESREGKLLVFEIDSAAVIHAMDSVEVFPYKKAQTEKIFAAFRTMLQSKMKNAPLCG